jgi:hypothetical protein
MKDEYPEINNYSWDLEKPEKLLKNITKRNDIRYFALLPTFKKYVNKTGAMVHFYYDGHWNEVGHELAAKSLYIYLVSNKLVPTEKENLNEQE